MANTLPNYPTNLLDVFNQGQWGLYDSVMGQQRTAESQAKENLLSAIQQREQEAAMHPFKLETEKAQAGSLAAGARLTNAQALEKEDAYRVLQGVPMDQRIAAKLAETLKGKSDNEKAMLNNEMEAAAIYAARGLQNGGKLSLQDLTRAQEQHPGLLPYLTSKEGLNRLAQVVTAHNALRPERQQSDSAHRISKEATLGAADITARSAERRTRMELDAGKFDKNRTSYLAIKALYGGNFEEAITAAASLARDAAASGDMETARGYAQLAEDFQQKLLQKQSAAGVEANKAKPNLNAFEIPTVTPPGQGVVLPKGPGPAQQPAPPRVAPQGALPPGWTYHGTK